MFKFVFKYLNEYDFSYINARNTKLPPFDASQLDESNGSRFVLFDY